MGLRLTRFEPPYTEPYVRWCGGNGPARARSYPIKAGGYFPRLRRCHIARSQAAWIPRSIPSISVEESVPIRSSSLARSSVVIW